MIIRKLNEDDKKTLATWIEQEPDHKETTTSDFYYESGTQTALYKDEYGPLFVIKFTPCLRMDMEFCPEANKYRRKQGMTDVFPVLMDQAKQQGFKEFVFSSVSERLIAFCRNLGFITSPDYRRRLL